MKIVVAMDSFKGSLTAREAVDATVRGLQRAIPGADIVPMPVSDGGEGILDVLLRLSGGERREVPVSGPLGEPLTAPYGLAGDTAYISLAAASGLPLVPADRRNPLLTSTLGTGQLILAALRAGARHIVIGLGGSATNDAATGLLTALGFRFRDASGNALPGCGASLAEIAVIDDTSVPPIVRQARFSAICDVDSPFTGPRGAARIFAPQKGADAAMVDRLEAGMRHFAAVIRRHTGIAPDAIPGAGAAGGTGGGLAALLGARLEPGITFVLDALHFDAAIADAALVITGEGRADRQSVMGKVVSGVLNRCRPLHKPLVIICGSYADADCLNAAGITSVFSLTSGPVTLAEAMQKDYAEAHLSQLSEQIGRLVQAFGSGQ